MMASQSTKKTKRTQKNKQSPNFANWACVALTGAERVLTVTDLGDANSRTLAEDVNNVLGAAPDIQNNLADLVAALPAGVLLVLADMETERSNRTADLGRELRKLNSGDPSSVIENPATSTVTFSTVSWHPRKVHQQTKRKRTKPAATDLRSHELATLTPAQANRAIAVVHRDFDDLRSWIRPMLQDYLRSLEGRSFGSLEKNQQFAKDLNGLLVRLGFRLKCQGENCGEASTLHVKKGATLTGAFCFTHGERAARASHGGRTSVPKLELILASTTR